MKNILWAVELFRDAPVRYWFESGALLGLWRDGGEISWDSDVDLGVTQDQLPVLEDWLLKLKSRGLSVSSRYYRGSCYGYTVRDRQNPERLPVNIHVYSVAGSIAWSPQIVNWPFLREKGLSSRSSRSGLAYRLLTYVHSESKRRRQGSLPQRLWRWLACYPVWGALVVLRNRLERQHWVKVWLYSAIYDAYTWVIPAHHFLKLDSMTLDGFSIPVPSDTESYLQARYGDWRTPVQDWVYWMDDGCIRPMPPEQMIEAVAF